MPIRKIAHDWYATTPEGREYLKIIDLLGEDPTPPFVLPPVVHMCSHVTHGSNVVFLCVLFIFQTMTGIRKSSTSIIYILKIQNIPGLAWITWPISGFVQTL